MSFEHVFNDMVIEADPFALCELQGQCALGLGSQTGATLHYILAGAGELIFQGAPSIKVSEGSLVLVPTLLSHTLRSFGDAGHPIPDCHPAELDLALHLGKGAAAQGTLLAVCSQMTVSLRGAGGLIDLIRQPIVEAISPDDPIAATISQLLNELSAPTTGSRAMIRAILLQCMIHLIRRRLSARDPALNWMAALIDESLWASLQQMLDRPGYPHTVESLAETAGMSRSTFAARFSAAYGTGPMELLRDLRMNFAASLLKESQLPVKRIAELSGFQSRSAFSRTFTSATGLSPHDFRANCDEN